MSKKKILEIIRIILRIPIALVAVHIMFVKLVLSSYGYGKSMQGVLSEDVYTKVKSLLWCSRYEFSVFGLKKKDRVYSLALKWILKTDYYTKFSENSDKDLVYKNNSKYKISRRDLINIPYKEVLESKNIPNCPYSLMKVKERYDGMGGKGCGKAKTITLKDLDSTINCDTYHVEIVRRIIHKDDNNLADYQIYEVPYTLLAELFKDYCKIVPKSAKNKIARWCLQVIGEMLYFDKGTVDKINLNKVQDIDKVSGDLLSLFAHLNGGGMFYSLRDNMEKFEYVKLEGNSYLLFTDGNNAIKITIKDKKQIINTLNVYESSDFSTVIVRHMLSLEDKLDLHFLLNNNVVFEPETMEVSVVELSRSERRRVLLSGEKEVFSGGMVF